MMFVLHFYAIYDEITSTAHDGHFPDPYKFQLSTKHITLKLFPFLLIERSLSISFTTGIFTRIGYLRINKFNLP